MCDSFPGFISHLFINTTALYRETNNGTQRKGEIRGDSKGRRIEKEGGRGRNRKEEGKEGDRGREKGEGEGEGGQGGNKKENK